MARAKQQPAVKAGDEEAKKRFQRRKSLFIMELQRQQANRYQMALDEMYYDGDQWTSDEAAEVRARKQNPVVYNEIKPTIDFLIGTERRTRTDFEVACRNDDTPEAELDAQNKTNLLKYLEDINRAPFVRSDASDDQFKAGLGWIEVGIRTDPAKSPIYLRNESWRNMLYDSLGQSRMPDDWRYLFRFKQVDTDIAKALAGKKNHELIDRATVRGDTQRQNMDWMNGSPMTGMAPSFENGLPMKWNTYDAEAWLTNPRERVMLIECWQDEPYYLTEEDQDRLSTYDPIRMRKRVSIQTEYDTVFEMWSPYKHEKYPFIPYWCYRRKRDGAPYGVVRQHRGPQDMLNKQMSKAQFRISVNQIRMEAGALNAEEMDEEELRMEAAAPDGVLIFADGALSGNKVQIREGQQLVEGDLKMADRNIQSIRQSSGVSGEDRGLDHNDVSGKARAIRQQQGSMLTAEPFDHMLLGRQMEGEITLSLAEQYHVEELTFSVPGKAKKFDYTTINKKQPDGSVLNDISKRQAQFIIGEQPWRQNLAEGAFEQVMEMMGQLASVAPQVVIAILDVVFEMHPHLPKKGILLQRIRSVTGQTDPDKPPTPEDEAAAARKKQVADAEFQAHLATLAANVAEAKAKGVKITAEAFAKQLEGLYMSAEAAQLVAMAPQLAPVMDELAKSGGFVDQNGAPLVAPLGAAPHPPQLPPGGGMQQHAAPLDGGQPPTGADGPLVGHEQGIRSPTDPGIQPGMA
jgi:hypothetical protein